VVATKEKTRPPFTGQLSVNVTNEPLDWCASHHLKHWADGGPTDLDNLVLLCGHHHRLIRHNDDWTVQLGADKLPEFLPPPYLDQTRTPRRNMFHRRT
jgi:hypothetical protein